ncbi:Serine/threonine-protein phosphatase PP1-beta catalytic subunit [Strongyloides ratti]|uniref:Serine/threonine-protein phosphatase n=1 Tax=Strongyloides ratti TaxID=34506 RepID=A0A090LBW1_STRRB|nr:Serine/threonine-protein phosphatase PP1-beta catalytic subunit [Strongyloides ratti]CEF65618.1 Serine/threonine-protein phosphatase PP1-beta catalytic subunit [Strongyloides ratti]
MSHPMKDINSTFKNNQLASSRQTPTKNTKSTNIGNGKKLVNEIPKKNNNNLLKKMECLINRMDVKQYDKKTDNRKDMVNSSYTAVIPINGKASQMQISFKDKSKNQHSFQASVKPIADLVTENVVENNLEEEDAKFNIKWKDEANKNIKIENWDFLDLDTFIEKHFNYKDESCIFYCIEEIQWIQHMFSKEIVSLPSLIEVDPPVIICGDIHGQYNDLLRIFKKFGKPPTKKFVFLGDYVDRGDNSLEVMLLLLALKMKYPEYIYLLRGNHELKHINKVYGFQEELKQRILDNNLMFTIYEEFNRLFSFFPLAALISKKVLCMHGGISSKIKSLDCIREIKRPLENVHSIACDLLWADPDKLVKLYEPNTARGVSSLFGQNALTQFCKKLNIDLVIRGHQVCQIGYEVLFEGHLITVFSASDYDEELKNLAGVIYIDKNSYVFPISLKCPKTEKEKIACKKKNDLTVEKN